MYADRKGWALEGVEAELSLEVDKSGPAQVTRIGRVLKFEGELTEGQRVKLVEIAEKCPVHRILSHEVDIRTTMG